MACAQYYWWCEIFPNKLKYVTYKALGYKTVNDRSSAKTLNAHSTSQFVSLWKFWDGTKYFFNDSEIHYFSLKISSECFGHYGYIPFFFFLYLLNNQRHHDPCFCYHDMLLPILDFGVSFYGYVSSSSIPSISWDIYV